MPSRFRRSRRTCANARQARARRRARSTRPRRVGDALTRRALRLSAAARRRRADPRPALERMVRPCAGARGRPEPRQPRARPDRPGDPFARRRPATAMRDELAFHRDVLDFRNCLLVEQPNGDFARTIARQLLFSTWQHMLYQRAERKSTDRVPARDRRQGGQGSRLSPRAGRRMDGPAGRRHRGERAADGRGARLVLALRPRTVRGRRTARRADRARDRRRSAQRSRPNIAPRSARCWPRRKLDAPPDQRPILGGRRGHHSEHLGHLLAVMQYLPRTYPDATW